MAPFVEHDFDKLNLKVYKYYETTYSVVHTEKQWYVPAAAFLWPYTTFPSKSFSGTFISGSTCWIVTFK